MIYEIKGQLATLNDHDLANRNNKFGGAALKREQTDLVMIQVRNKHKITKPCFMKFHWMYASKHDFDNICFAKKYILDGMVKAGILPSDSQKWVLGFDGDDFTKVKKGEEKVLVEVEEVEEAIDGQLEEGL